MVSVDVSHFSTCERDNHQSSMTFIKKYNMKTTKPNLAQGSIHVSCCVHFCLGGGCGTKNNNKVERSRLPGKCRGVSCYAVTVIRERRPDAKTMLRTKSTTKHIVPKFAVVVVVTSQKKTPHTLLLVVVVASGNHCHYKKHTR